MNPDKKEVEEEIEGLKERLRILESELKNAITDEEKERIKSEILDLEKEIKEKEEILERIESEEESEEETEKKGTETKKRMPRFRLRMPAPKLNLNMPDINIDKVVEFVIALVIIVSALIFVQKIEIIRQYLVVVILFALIILFLFAEPILPEGLRNFGKIIITLLIIAMVILGSILFIFPQMVKQGVPMPHPGSMTRLTKESFENLVNNWVDFFKSQMAYATGNYVSGEKTEKVYTTIKMSDLKGTTMLFYDKDNPQGNQIYTKLKVNSFYSNTINVKLSCILENLENGEKHEIDTIQPKEINSYGNAIDQDVLCQIPSDEINKIGNYRVTIIADVSNIVTKSKLENYFIDNDALKDKLKFVAENYSLDLLNDEDYVRAELYAFPDLALSKPISTYTSGPIELNLQTEVYPIIGVEENKLYMLKLAIGNPTNGRIKQINSGKIYLPDGVQPQIQDISWKFKSEGNTIEFTQGYTSLDFGYVKNRVQDVSIIPFKITNKQQFLSQGIYLPNYKEFNAEINYDYEVEKQLTFSVEKKIY